MSIEIINLTPHEINIHVDGQTRSVPASGTIARCSEQRIKTHEVDGIPVDVVSFGNVEDLPEPTENTIYIVSHILASAVPERRDVYIPGKLIRDESGNITGSQGLSQVPMPE